MLIDTHAHLNFNAYEKDLKEVISRSLENDVWMINVGTNYKTSKKAVEIAKEYERGIFAAIGLHPINLDTGLVKIKKDEAEGSHFEKEFNYQKYKALGISSSKGKIVAIGEIGLDYYYRPKTKRKLALFKQKQRELLLRELKLARELNLPVILHCRMAHQDLIEILNFQFSISNFQIKGVMHGFVGTKEQLKEYLEMGFYIGFNGIIFKKIEGINFEENIKKTPLEKILIETDCPYLTPPPFENEKNEPLYVRYIVRQIAKIKNISSEKIAEITTKNAKRLFELE